MVKENVFWAHKKVQKLKTKPKKNQNEGKEIQGLL